MSMAVWGLCEGCGRRAEMCMIAIANKMFGVCEICRARISIINRKYPEVFHQICEGITSLKAREAFTLPQIPKEEIYAEVVALRGIETTHQTKEVSNPMRPFDDLHPLHPIPLLGKTAEPDELPPQVADRPNLCVLSTSDKLYLHGAGVCWSAGDEEQLPPPKEEVC